MAQSKFLYPFRDPDNPFKVTLVPCSEEVYRAVMPEIWRGIKQMKQQGACCCPRCKAGLCDLDCAFCQYRKCGNTFSLDAPISDEGDTTFGDTIADDSAFSETFDEKLTIEMGFREISDTDYQILLAVEQYGSEREAAKELGIARSTFKRHLAAAKEYARVALKDIL